MQRRKKQKKDGLQMRLDCWASLVQTRGREAVRACPTPYRNSTCLAQSLLGSTSVLVQVMLRAISRPGRQFLSISMRSHLVDAPGGLTATSPGATDLRPLLLTYSNPITCPLLALHSASIDPTPRNPEPPTSQHRLPRCVHVNGETTPPHPNQSFSSFQKACLHHYLPP